MRDFERIDRIEKEYKRLEKLVYMIADVTTANYRSIGDILNILQKQELERKK